ncbi:hypothetical protein [Bifidobacterium biavatii]|uniref:hypothetical protein n=1 Tax=Bifidobacterium biavatii TaxID=762212 RepID=UPI0005297ECC|nr:hypothetical protein [Bifidobacterium biavatii]
MDWIAEHGVELAGFLFTLAVTVTGWVVEHKAAKARDDERREDIKLLESQVDALRDQAASLSEQTRMRRADFDKTPFSEAEWVRGAVRRVTVTGARRVYVESVECMNPDVLFRLRTPLPDSFEPSETIEYLINGPYPVVFSWRWDDKPDMPLRTVRRVSYRPER